MFWTWLIPPPWRAAEARAAEIISSCSDVANCVWITSNVIILVSVRSLVCVHYFVMSIPMLLCMRIAYTLSLCTSVHCAMYALYNGTVIASPSIMPAWLVANYRKLSFIACFGLQYLRSRARIDRILCLLVKSVCRDINNNLLSHVVYHLST